MTARARVRPALCALLLLLALVLSFGMFTLTPRQTLAIGGFAVVMLAVVMAVLFAVAGGALIDVLTTAPEVREVARRYLPWLVLMPVVGVASWMLDGIFIGATLTREMRNAMLPAVAIFAVAAYAVFFIAAYALPETRGRVLHAGG